MQYVDYVEIESLMDFERHYALGACFTRRHGDTEG